MVDSGIVITPGKSRTTCGAFYSSRLGRGRVVVLDPFAGTGSFLLAAARLGREARGYDNNP